LEEIRVSVEPEHGDVTAVEIAPLRLAFPMRFGKIQRLLLPEDTLRRDRLLDWMWARINRRIIYVVAEAGFGKTTLVADFARRSRIRTFWYRLDEDDTDGLVFMRYLVASCRSVDPQLLPRTAARLSETAAEPATLDAVLATFLAEYEQLGSTASLVVLDDYHMAEQVESVRKTVEKLIAKAPAGLTFIFATRRVPELSVALLKARNSLAQLGREDLRFEESETEQLFSEAYHHPLEPDVLHDLQARTDGWAASLQLVKTAVEGRTPSQVRAFVGTMNGAEGDLYDYLAQEVVGELEPGLRRFLLRTSLLDEVDPGVAACITGFSEPEVRRLVAAAQRIGLLSRSDGIVGSSRAHPLVREFLLSRLEEEIGQDAILGLHREIAALFEPISWRLSCRHWAAAGEDSEVRRVLCAAVPAIAATGDLDTAIDLMHKFPDPQPNPWYLLLHARWLLNETRYLEAATLINQADVLAQTSRDDDRNLRAQIASAELAYGTFSRDPELCAKAAKILEDLGDPEQDAIGAATQAGWRAADLGSLDLARHTLEATLRLNRERHHDRFAGVSLNNLSVVHMAQGNCEAALSAALEAERLLSTSGNDFDVTAAQLNAAVALGAMGKGPEVTRIQSLVTQHGTDRLEPGGLGELVELHACYGDPGRSSALLASRPDLLSADEPDAVLMRAVARLAVVHGDLDLARASLARVTRLTMVAGLRAAIVSLGLVIDALVEGPSDDLERRLKAAEQVAADQQAWFWQRAIATTRTLLWVGTDNPDGARLAGDDRPHLSMQAELVVARLEDLDAESFGVVRSEAVSRPDRWAPVLRRHLSQRRPDRIRVRRAVDLLEQVGREEDIALLRGIGNAKPLRLPDAGKFLIRRLAPRAYVDDLGMLSVRIGDRLVRGADVRRKVLSLLGYLLTRPQYGVCRDEVIDALWPDTDPGSAANSLNQTSYFLRRILEEGYDDDTSPGYVGSKGDRIWLEPDLVLSRSGECQSLLSTLRRDASPELVARLADTYTGRWGADFLYDDWAASYRDHLHAAFLERIERAIAEDMRIGAFDRAISVAQKALTADPDAEQIELQLVHLYRLTGAHAAATEQYGHYAAVLRDQLGVEPPPLESM
jgi:ATP/maltotriose-dependent transcriptional regulator MalT/DNA-binding SARP family transcriptional activator